MYDSICEILVVMRAGTNLDKLCKLLKSLGYRVNDVHSGASALRSAFIRNYDIVLSSNNLPDMTGLSMSLDMLDQKDCSVILITTDRNKADIEARYKNYDITCLIKPASRVELEQALKTTYATRRKNRLLKDKIKFQRVLEKRANLAKAKKVLMDKYNMSESIAYRQLQKKSMNTGIPVKDIAQKIIDTDGEYIKQ